jgi:ATP-dependent Lon protease
VILPQANTQDLLEIQEEVRRDMTFVPVATLEDVLRVALPAVAATLDATASADGPARAAAAAAGPR